MTIPNAEASPPQSGASFVWGDTSGLPLVPADFLHWRTIADRCYLTVGQMNLPLLDGPFPDGLTVPVTPVIRLVVTPETLRMWAAMINSAADEYKKIEGGK